MKKLIAILLTGIICASLLTACSIGECDICGDTGILHEVKSLGFTFNVCSDCD